MRCIPLVPPALVLHAVHAVLLRPQSTGWSHQLACTCLRAASCTLALPSPPARPPARAQEFLAIQSEQPRNVGFFGTRNMGFMHQQLIEVLSYAMLLTVRGQGCSTAS